MKDAYSLRSTLQPGDLGFIVYLHGVLYARECGWDHTFEAYVAAPLAEFVRSPSPRQRLWIAEKDEHIVGCIAIVSATMDDIASAAAQLRWFLVAPAARGMGLGKRLLQEAVSFSKARGCKEIVLWTEQSLTAAAHLYRSAGFRKTEEKPGRMWGADVVEERYELQLT